MAAKEKEQSKEKDLERMTVKELRTLAAETTDLVGVHAMKKAELLAAIKETKGIKEEKAPREKIKKRGVTVKQLKAMIVELKNRRQQAREARDKRMAAILRRRINRARKRTRKISQVRPSQYVPNP
jgi:predicted aldo/keto reductase-like oxidoreductase